MSRTTFPPTPEASTEIFGKDGGLIADDAHFSLPPSAIGGRESSSASSLSDKASESSYHPNSPICKPRSIAPARKRSNLTSKDEFTLPPPPSRKRKIIQMMPSEQSQSSPTIAPKSDPPTTGTKRKQNGTTSAGRKVARKTAHSLIERRRRSKMNDEFSVLKNMIPACAGQEMHKLAILQASTEYLRYLERCIKDLKAAAHDAKSIATLQDQAHATASTTVDIPNNESMHDCTSSGNSDDAESDDDMQDTFDAPPLHAMPKAPPPSPEHSRSQSYTRPHSSSSHLSYPVNYSSRKTTLSPIAAPHTSPAALFPATPPPSSHFGPVTYPGHASQAQYPPKAEYTALPASSLSSPAHEEEASAALLMLNAVDRREALPEAAVGFGHTPRSPNFGGRRGLSVRDLMSN